MPKAKKAATAAEEQAKPAEEAAPEPKKEEKPKASAPVLHKQRGRFRLLRCEDGSYEIRNHMDQLLEKGAELAQGERTLQGMTRGEN